MTLPALPPCVWCGDLKRHAARLEELQASGLTDEHPLVVAARRRIRGAQAFDDREHGRSKPPSS